MRRGGQQFLDLDVLAEAELEDQITAAAQPTRRVRDEPRDERQAIGTAEEGHRRLMIADLGLQCRRRPIEDVRRGPGSQSEPGFRADQVLWAGFSPGTKQLAADIALRVPPAAPYLPLRLHLTREDGGVTLRVTNATTTPVMSYEGVVRPTEIARLLDATRRSSLAGERVKAAFATFLGTVRVPKRPLQIEAPLRVQGELDLPGREPVTFSRVLGDGQRLGAGRSSGVCPGCPARAPARAGRRRAERCAVGRR